MWFASSAARRSIGVLFAAAAIATSQQPSSDPVFHVGTRLVQISVVAQDQDGKPVADLRREDFRIFDNDAEQEIRVFMADQPAPARSAEATPGTFTNRIETDGRTGYSVLLFDNLNVDPQRRSFGYTAKARAKALEALREIPAGDRIAVYALGCKFQVVREFTSDRDSLLQQMDKFAPAPDACMNPSTDGPEYALTERHMGGRIASEAEAAIAIHQQQGMNEAAGGVTADISNNEMQQLADHLAGIPGRKNLIWLTSVFYIKPANLRKLIDAGAALYPVDTIGSMIATAAAKKERAAPILALAAATGGVAFVDRDDFDAGIRSALNDGRISYTLGFYQPDESKSAPFHRIAVQVSRPGVMLRYQTSYTVAPREPVSSNPVRDLVLAMNRPVNATAIGMTATATRLQDKVDLAVTYDITGLDLQVIGGLWRGQAELVLRFVTTGGVPAGDTLAETMTFTLRPATYRSMLEKGARYHKLIRIPAKAVEMRLLVGSLTTGKIGTLTIPLSEVRSTE